LSRSCWSVGGVGVWVGVVGVVELLEWWSCWSGGGVCVWVVGV